MFESASSSVNPAVLEAQGFMFLTADKKTQLVPTSADRAAAAAEERTLQTPASATSTEWVSAVNGSAGVRYESGESARVLIGIGSKSRYRRACKHPGCNKMTRNGPTPESKLYCRTHGGGVFCNVPGCSNGAKAGYQTCIRHGAGNRCQIKKNHPDQAPHAYRQLGRTPVEISGHFRTPRPEYANVYCCTTCFKKFR